MTQKTKDRITAVALSVFAVVSTWVTWDMRFQFDRHPDMFTFFLFIVYAVLLTVTAVVSWMLWTREGKEDRRHK